jgi:transposase
MVKSIMSPIEIALQEAQEENVHLKEQINALSDVIEHRDATIKAQQIRLTAALKRIYGRRSEKLDPNQMLFDDVILAAEKYAAPNQVAIHPEVVEEKVRAHIRRKHPGRKPLPAHLERIEHYLDIPEQDKFTADGKERPLIGLDITEKLDYQPCVLVVHRYIRPKYGADDDITGAGVKQHPPVDGPIDKCLAQSGLLAHIITEKYEHHTPLYRQELKFQRQGIEISRQTMAGWNRGCAQALKPLWERMREQMLTNDLVLNDDTPVEMLEPGAGQTRTTRLWCTVGSEDLKYTMYNFTLSRGRDGPLEFFKGYQGYFLCDDYSGYNELFKNKKVVYVSCWSHARRYFVEARDTSPKAATEILTLIARLYLIEKEHKRSSPEDRLKARHKQSTRVLKKIRKWLLDNQASGEHLPQSPMGKAIAHALKIWRHLCMYLRDGRIPIDNNLAENGIRPIALSRKNWLFVGNENGGETAAILMSFCATCRKLKINTWEYLKDVLQRINTHPMSKIDQLLPDHWQALRQRQLNCNQR